MSGDLIQIILTSALVSSLISGFFIIINEWLRRKSEEKRAKLQAALGLTKMRQEQIIEILKRTGKIIKWPAPLNTFAKTFKYVDEIWDDRYKESKKPPLNFTK